MNTIVLLFTYHLKTIGTKVSPETLVLGPDQFGISTEVSLDTSALVPKWFDTEVY